MFHIYLKRYIRCTPPPPKTNGWNPKILGLLTDVSNPFPKSGRYLQVVKGFRGCKVEAFLGVEWWSFPNFGENHGHHGLVNREPSSKLPSYLI